MNREKFDMLMKDSSLLPIVAFATLPSDKRQVIVIQNGINGYYPQCTFESEEIAEICVNNSNERLGVSVEESEAMLCKSLFGGWNK